MTTSYMPLVNGISVEYALSGPQDAETILMVHGLGTNLRQFEAQAESLGSSYRVLLVSLRGHGESGMPENPTASDFTIRMMTADIRLLLSALGIDSVHFVGSSLGGLIGFQLLDDDPGIVRTLTTFGTTAELNTAPTAVWLPTSATRFLGPATLGRMAKLGTKDRHVASELAGMIAKANKEAMLLIQKNIANYSYLETLRECRTPVLVIRGEHDNGINQTLESTLNVLHGKPDSSVKQMTGVGHFANMESPDEFTREFLAFVTHARSLAGVATD